MDISSKYRTKCPPKEHEEAVRMLLEGIGKQDHQNIDTTATIVSSSNLANNNNNSKACATSSNSYDYDDGRSIRSSSSQSIVSSEHITTTNLRTKSNKMHQKSTSTSEDNNSLENSSSESDHDEAMFREPIPSRTIAVQCDLKSSSLKRASGGVGDNLIDGSMQASSISSTRYGFYNFTPETLENRRKMQRSISSRELTGQGVSSAVRVDSRPDQIEAPTSMSELSMSDSGLENRHNARSIKRNQTVDDNMKRAVTSSSSYTSSSNSYTMHHNKQTMGAGGGGGPKVKVGSSKRVLSPSGGDNDDDLNYQFRRTEPTPSRATRSATKLDGDDSSTARAKINSLPRRPVTALSYVSTTKLRGQQSPNAYLDNNNDSSERMKPIKNRTMSQQTLTRPRFPAHEHAGSSSDGLDSDSELNAASRAPRDSQFLDGHRSNNDDNVHHVSERKYRQQMEHLAPRGSGGAAVTNGSMSPTKPPRPTLISSKHEEQILDYKTLDRNPANGVRSTPAYHQHQQQNVPSGSGNKYAPGRPVAPEGSGSSPSSYRSRLVHESRNEFDKFATIDRSGPMNGYRDSYEASEYTSRLRNHGRPAMMRQTLVEPDLASLARECSPSSRDQYQVPRQDYQLNSMSLSRRIRPTGSRQQQPLNYSEDQNQTLKGSDVNVGAGGGYYTASRIKPHKLSSNDRAHSQINLQKSPSYTAPAATETVTRRPVKHLQQQDLSDVEVRTPRSTSMHQINRSTNMMNGDRYDPSIYATAINHDSIENHLEMNSQHPNEQMDFKSKRGVAREFTGRDLYRSNFEDGSQPCDFDLPSTRTWANPSARTINTAAQLTNTDAKQLANGNRKTSRSFSMRDVNSSADFNAKRYERYDDHQTKTARKNNLTNYNSSSESSSLFENAQRFARLEQTLDYDSQHRLNEIGLPEVNPFITSTNARSRTEGPGSYLGTNGLASYSKDTDALYTSSGRAPQITGRASSQQSLTRPTMPLSSSRRRAAGGSNHSGSDVGGSSMSLVSRLHGRYENAHTRTPVVMYIPKVMPRASSHDDGSVSLIGKSSTLRKSSRSRQKSSSQDRSRRRSVSRNGSDSESSSMLRTLVRPRSRHPSNYSSKRAARMHGAIHDDEDEDIDGIGQLASEMDSYKFRRRYSVPKDAKINWFAKLKQRVSSGGK